MLTRIEIVKDVEPCRACDNDDSYHIKICNDGGISQGFHICKQCQKKLIEALEKNINDSRTN